MSFNPRVREGRDKGKEAEYLLKKGFNPRVREGRDCIDGVRGKWLDVSIHASVKDATWFAVFPLLTLGFNPRVREGRDKHP